MKYNKDLIEIVRKKEFQTFWHCLDYLLLAGYPSLDAFGISLKEFGETKIYSNVAFIRFELLRHSVMFTGQNTIREPKKATLVIGLIDDSNIHLSGLYGTYRELLVKEPSLISHVDSEELESTCEIIRITDLTPFIINYLRIISKTHFGFEVFEFPQLIPERPIPIDYNDFRERMLLGAPHSPSRSQIEGDIFKVQKHLTPEEYLNPPVEPSKKKTSLTIKKKW
jgi:hypothetical protein